MYTWQCAFNHCLFDGNSRRWISRLTGSPSPMAWPRHRRHPGVATTTTAAGTRGGRPLHHSGVVPRKHRRGGTTIPSTPTPRPGVARPGPVAHESRGLARRLCSRRWACYTCRGGGGLGLGPCAVAVRWGLEPVPQPRPPPDARQADQRMTQRIGDRTGC